MFIARRDLSTLLCSVLKSGIRSNLTEIAMPLFLNRAGGNGSLGYKHCAPPE